MLAEGSLSLSTLTAVPCRAASWWTCPATPPCPVLAGGHRQGGGHRLPAPAGGDARHRGSAPLRGRAAQRAARAAPAAAVQRAGHGRGHLSLELVPFSKEHRGRVAARPTARCRRCCWWGPTPSSTSCSRSWTRCWTRRHGQLRTLLLDSYQRAERLASARRTLLEVRSLMAMPEDMRAALPAPVPPSSTPCAGSTSRRAATWSGCPEDDAG